MLHLNKIGCCFGEETDTAELSKGQPSLGPTLHKTPSLETLRDQKELLR